MPDSNDTTSLRDYFAVLRNQRWLILGITLVAVAIGIGYSVLKDPTYTAEATLEFKNPSADLTVVAPGSQVIPDLNPAAAAAADSRVVTRDDVVQRVAKQVPELDMSEDELRDSITAEVQTDSNLVAIEASSGDADESALLANAFADETTLAVQTEQRKRYAQSVKELQRALDEGGLDPSLEASYNTAIGRLDTLSRVAEPVAVTRPATEPDSPSSPKPVRDTILAAILGLLLGIGAAFLRNALDRRIKDSHEVQRELGLPLVGYVRSDTLGLTGIGRNGDSFVSEDDLEAFRILRTNVDFLPGDEEISSLVVTSALPEEGKSTVAAWYAYVSAVAGRRTLLVECDFRRPVLATRFGVEGTPGLSEYLGNGLKPKDILRTVEVKGREAIDVLPLIPAGENVFQPTEMIASQKFKDFVGEVSDAYDLVVFDSAPLLPVSDTLQLVPEVDGVLFCVRLDQTTRDQAQAAKQALEHLSDKPTGLVITGVQRGGEDDYYGYYSSYRTSSRAAAAPPS